MGGDPVLIKPIIHNFFQKSTREGTGRPVVKKRGDPLYFEVLEWQQEFRDKLVDDEIPAHGDCHASQPITKYVRIWVNTMFMLISLKTEIARSVKGLTLRTLWSVVIKSPEFFSTKYGSIASSAWDLYNLSCAFPHNHQYAVVVQDPSISVQKQNFTRNPEKEACESSWNPRGNQKSFTVTIPWNSAEFGKISLGIIARLHHTAETNGIVERVVRRVKEGTSAALLQSGLNESWWADLLDCYTYLRNVTDLLFDGEDAQWKTFWATI